LHYDVHPVETLAMPFRAAVLALSVLLAAASASAAEVTYTVEGSLAQVHPGLAGTFAVGDRFSITVTYDSNAAGEPIFDNLWNYPTAITALHVVVGDYVATSATGLIQVTNGNDDMLNFSAEPDGADVAGRDLIGFSLQLRGPGSLLPDTSLPAAALPLSAFTGVRVFSLFFRAPTESASLPIAGYGEVTNAAPTFPAGAALTATRVGSSSIALAWPAAADDAGVAGYNVYRDGAFLASLSAGTLAYEATGLALGTSYQFQVQAFDAANAASAPLSLTTRTRATAGPAEVAELIQALVRDGKLKAGQGTSLLKKLENATRPAAAQPGAAANQLRALVREAAAVLAPADAAAVRTAVEALIAELGA
jgi:hypothetical protein